MALSISKTIAEAADGLSFTIVDTTGTYDINTKPGGYGAGQTPNNKRLYTDIAYSFIRVLLPNTEETAEKFIYLANADAEALANPANTTGYEVENTVLYPASTAATTLVDGVYRFIYYPCFITVENVQNFTFTNGSATVTVPNDDQALTNLSYILLPADGSVTADATHHYEVDSIDTTVSPVVITLSRAYTGATGAKSSNALVFGYSDTSYSAAQYNLRAGLASKVSQLTTSECTCKKTKINNLTEAVTLTFTIDASMDCYNYSKAQDVIDYLTDYLATGSTGGCGC